MAKKKDEDSEERSNLSPEAYLEVHKIDCDHVWAVFSPGDSDFGPYETILFTDSNKMPRTAVLTEESLVCRDGWDWFYVDCY